MPATSKVIQFGAVSGMSESRLEDEAMLGQLLGPALGVRRAKKLARLLIDRFQTLQEAIAAPGHLLMEIPGIDHIIVQYLQCIMATAQSIARRRIKSDRPLIDCWSDLIDYCHAQMAYETKEQMRILYLDKRNRLIIDEVHHTGTIDHTWIYSREVIKRALELGSTALILVHNHPSGDPSPSSADVSSTLQLQDSAKPLGITVHDHLIIAKSGHTSLTTQSLLRGARTQQQTDRFANLKLAKF